MSTPNCLRELAGLFLKLGTIAFGGPLAHIAMMEDEVVTRRGWMERERFLDLIGATNLIPGPNSTELAIHIGKERAGWPGLLVAGACFILPAFCIVLALAALYAQYGNLPETRWILYGVQPVIIAIIAQAAWKFAQTAFKGLYTVAIFLAAVGLSLWWQNELAVIALAAATGLVFGLAKRGKGRGTSRAEETDKRSSAPAILLLGVLPATVPPTLFGLFWSFLKIGSVIYGSGYVLLAYLRSDLVENLGWLTDQQLLDAVAIGQVTPGPVFTTATFIGYQIAVAHQLPGWAGAVVATLGIFLPSFLFVGLIATVLEKHRDSPVLRVFLDTVVAASLALMAIVLFQLGQAALVDLPTLVIAVAALGVLLVTKLNSAWLIAAGMILGFLLRT